MRDADRYPLRGLSGDSVAWEASIDYTKKWVKLYAVHCQCMLADALLTDKQASKP